MVAFCLLVQARQNLVTSHSQSPVPGAPKDSSKVRTQWHASTKGTLVRRYRVPTKKEGRRLLTAISALLSDDDTFRDVSTHKV